MSRRGGTRIRAERKPIIVLAGESSNDRMVMRVLLEACCPKTRGRIVEINDGVSLRGAGDEKLAARVQQLGRSIRARAAREQSSVACVFVHEDLDDVDSEKCGQIHSRVQRVLERELGHAYYVLATWEIEAWLLLFPEALADFTDSWSVPARYRGADTGMIHDPKRVMRQQVSKAGPRYRESDAPGITERVVALGLHMKPAGTNKSYSRFRDDADSCCRSL